MAIFSFISSALGPLINLFDELHTSTEEKLALRNELVVLENVMGIKILEYETKLLESNASIIKAEATGHSWIQRSWRPITMMTFLGLVVLDSFGLLAFRLADEAWTLLQIGLGGYVIGRSAEKLAPAIAGALKKKGRSEG